MSYPTVFANLAGGTQPASLLDTMFNICGNQGNIGCSASGVTAITLTPNTNFFLPTSYVNNQMFTFTAVGTSNGAVTLQVGALAALNVYTAQGAQANNGDIANGATYTVVFNSALNSAAGGWVIVGAGGAASLLGPSTITPTPGGYLTMASGQPIITATTTVNAGGNLFYTPFTSNSVPVLTSTALNWTSMKFAELQLTMNAAHLANNIYDVFIGQAASGGIQIGTGPTWSAGGGSVTQGSAARGSGAGSTALVRVNGLLVNNVTVTARNGASTFSFPAQTAIYVCTILMDAVNGQITNHVGAGQSRKWSIWNYYNRVPITLVVADATASWTTTANFTWRPTNNTANNSGFTIIGFAEEGMDATAYQEIQVSTTGTLQALASSGIGFNSTSAPSGFQGTSGVVSGSGAGSAVNDNNIAFGTFPPASAFGFNGITQLEQVTSIAANNTVTFSGGTGAGQQMLLRWRG